MYLLIKGTIIINVGVKIMFKKTIIISLMLVFSVLASAFAFAGTGAVVIDNAFVNGQNLAESRTNFLFDSNNLNIVAVLKGVNFLGNVNVQAILIDSGTGNTIADARGIAVVRNTPSGVNLNLQLFDSLKRQKNFHLIIEIFDERGNTIEQNSYGIKFTGGTKGKGALDVSFDRVKANNKIVAASKPNFLEESNSFDVLVEFTTLEDLENSHIEATLRDLRTGFVVADATPNFNLADGSSASKLLRLDLIDRLKRSDSLELTVKIADAEGNSFQQSFGIRMRDGNGIAINGALDVSIDRVKVNNLVLASSSSNFINETDNFNVFVELTALENLKDAHVEAVIRDLNTGFVVADATPNFNLADGSSASKQLKLSLLNDLKKSDSFELKVKIIDAEGDSFQKSYGIGMEDGKSRHGVRGKLDISVDRVEVEGKDVVENENNFVLIDKGEKKLELKIAMTALENIEDAHIDAVLMFGNGDVAADSTALFDLEDEQSIVKALEVPLVGKFEQDSFKLKVRISDAEGNLQERFYGLKLSQKKFPFIVSSIALNPETKVEAGKNLIAKISFKDSGILPLEGVIAKASIPELGVSASKFVDQIGKRQEESSEELVLKIPDDTPTGTYTLKSEIASQFGNDRETKEIQVFVLGKSDTEVVNDKLVVTIPILEQDVKNDGTEVVYRITLKNEGSGANAYTLSLDGGNWANLRLSEGNTFVLKPNEAKTVNIFVSTKSRISGTQLFFATVKSNDEILKQITFKANVVPVKKFLIIRSIFFDWKTMLMATLIVMVVVLVAIGLFYGIKDAAEKETALEEPKREPQVEAYY